MVTVFSRVARELVKKTAFVWNQENVLFFGNQVDADSAIYCARVIPEVFSHHWNPTFVLEDCMIILPKTKEPKSYPIAVKVRSVPDAVFDDHDIELLADSLNEVTSLSETMNKGTPSSKASIILNRLQSDSRYDVVGVLSQYSPLQRE